MMMNQIAFRREPRQKTGESAQNRRDSGLDRGRLLIDDVTQVVPVTPNRLSHPYVVLEELSAVRCTLPK